jgi:HEAT repeat protein
MNVVDPPSKTADDPLPDLIRALRGRSAPDRVRAAKDLGRLGWLARDAMPALVTALGDDDAKVREAAAQAVGQMGPEALPNLVRMLDHDDKYVRRHAVWAMGKLGPLARSALRDLCRVLKDPDPRTASGAAQALGNMSTDGAEAVPLLAEAMRGTNIVLCRLAAKALSQIGPPALATLIAHLQHSDPFVRGESALALGWMGAAARSAVPFLAQVVRGPRGFDERSAPAKKPSDSVFSGTATPAAMPVPDEGGTTEDNCRVYAAQALGRIGPPASRALPDLQAAARHGSSALRSAAEQAVRMIEGTD